MGKVLQEVSWACFFGRSHHSNGTKIHLDATLHITDLSSTLWVDIHKNNQLCHLQLLLIKINNKTIG